MGDGYLATQWMPGRVKQESRGKQPVWSMDRWRDQECRVGKWREIHCFLLVGWTAFGVQWDLGRTLIFLFYDYIDIIYLANHIGGI